MRDYKPRQEVSSWHPALTIGGMLLISLNLLLLVERLLS